MTPTEEAMFRRLIKVAYYWCAGGCGDRCPKHLAIAEARALLEGRKVEA